MMVDSNWKKINTVGVIEVVLSDRVRGIKLRAEKFQIVINRSLTLLLLELLRRQIFFGVHPEPFLAPQNFYINEGQC